MRYLRVWLDEVRVGSVKGAHPRVWVPVASGWRRGTDHPVQAEGQQRPGGCASGQRATADRLDEPREALRQGQWERARAGFEAALADEESAEALEGLAEAAWWLEDAPEVLSARQRAYRLFRRRGEDVGAGRLATELGFDHAVFRLELAVANGWFQRAHRLLDEHAPVAEQVWLALREAEVAYHTAGDMDHTRQLAARAHGLAERLSLLDAELMALALEGLALVGLGEIEEGLQRLDEAAAAAVGGELQSYKAISGICCFVIFACERVRDIERASQWCEQYMGYCQRSGLPGYLAFCQAHHASVLAARGRWAEAEQQLEDAREALQARPAWSLTVCSRLGELRRRQGHFEEAAALFERAQPDPGGFLGGARLARDRGDAATAREIAEGMLARVPDADRVERLAALELVAELRCAAGETDAAEEAVTEFEAVAEAAGTDWLMGRANHLRGQLALTSGDPTTARIRLQVALDTYQRVGLPFDEALARAELARSLHAADRHEPACEQARTAREGFEGLGATVEERRVRAMLDELCPADHAPAGGLSPREAEVLRLVARGATNQEIADELVVSPHTVRRHVSNLLTKLDLSSRTAAAAWAHEHDLL